MLVAGPQRLEIALDGVDAQGQAGSDSSNGVASSRQDLDIVPDCVDEARNVLTGPEDRLFEIHMVQMGPFQLFTEGRQPEVKGVFCSVATPSELTDLVLHPQRQPPAAC